jgi:hypothetical protein
MESRVFDELAERFWKGECSEAEEKLLKEACLYGDLPERHQELKEYMSFLAETADGAMLDEVFDHRIMAEIERREASSSGGMNWFRIAAGIAVVLGLMFAMRTLLGPDDSKAPVLEEMAIVDTYEDPEVAYREVKKALSLVGRKMNDGMAYSAKIGAFEQATDEIEKDNKEQTDDSLNK